MAQNAEIEIKGNTLTIKVDLTKNVGPSASGKNLLITKVNEKMNGITVQVNVYKKGD